MATNRRTNQQITLVMLVLVSITVLTLNYRGEASRAIGHVKNAGHDALSPFQRGIQAVLHPFGDVLAGAIHYGALEAQNQRLQNALGAERRTVAEGVAASRAADQVLRLAHLKFATGIRSVAGEVINEPTSNFAQTVELGVGTGSGIGPGMPVIADTGAVGGLIGTVVSASTGTSTVQLISDPHSSVDVVLTSGSTWVATGNGVGQNLSLHEPAGSLSPARVGDTVYTSGLGRGAYPAGIPVGVVASVRSTAGGFSQSVTVKPFVNVNELQYVSVLQWLQPA